MIQKIIYNRKIRDSFYISVIFKSWNLWIEVPGCSSIFCMSKFIAVLVSFLVTGSVLLTLRFIKGWSVVDEWDVSLISKGSSLLRSNDSKIFTFSTNLLVFFSLHRLESDASSKRLFAVSSLNVQLVWTSSLLLHIVLDLVGWSALLLGDLITLGDDLFASLSFCFNFICLALNKLHFSSCFSPPLLDICILQQWPTEDEASWIWDVLWGFSSVEFDFYK